VLCPTDLPQVMSLSLIRISPAFEDRVLSSDRKIGVRSSAFSDNVAVSRFDLVRSSFVAVPWRRSTCNVTSAECKNCTQTSCVSLCLLARIAVPLNGGMRCPCSFSEDKAPMRHSTNSRCSSCATLDFFDLQPNYQSFHHESDPSAPDNRDLLSGKLCLRIRSASSRNSFIPNAS
jgi:hypothetical protein